MELTFFLSERLSLNEMYAVAFAAMFATFLEHRHLYKDSIIYEDLMNDPQGERARERQSHKIDSI